MTLGQHDKSNDELGSLYYMIKELSKIDVLV